MTLTKEDVDKSASLDAVKLEKKDVDKFRSAYQSETGEIITTDEAWEMTARVLRLASKLLEADTVARRGADFDEVL